MILNDGIRILIDAREFTDGRFTGIARVLQGLTESLAESAFCKHVSLAVHNPLAVSSALKLLGNLSLREIPTSFLESEKALSNLSRQFDLFISPYPKLPLFGVHCRAIHIIHDVLDLTHPLYRTRFKTLFDRYRLKNALHRADITWYDSSWSMTETQKHFGRSGRNPKVRHPGIGTAFVPKKQNEDGDILETYRLEAGYVLALGNGLPHKNLGILLDIADQIERPIAFAGVRDNDRRYWEPRHRGIHSKWIRHVEEKHLPAIIRGAFCLVQPSLVEGYGYPPLEAMACGIPAVVSDIPVLVETTGNQAFKANPLNSKAWLDALGALENASLYRDAANKGLKWAQQFQGILAWQGYVTDIENLITKEGM